ncbi:hypothetical protein B0H16DRAFT_35058 [Mycena metata]|uniref:Uncharacterized protein n=1 Tax=Mycena metata TaxID=1033252 RepID=A0AAD7KIQ8_9AGAR|nr:hypothetical protein B0H16DRAFT_35058 [Mycena metata]
MLPRRPIPLLLICCKLLRLAELPLSSSRHSVLLIQSLASPESSEAISAANSMPSSSAQPYRPVAPTPSVKEFDLVFQYHETSHERWILPRVPVICEKVADPRAPGLTYDIVLTLALPSPTVIPSPAEMGVDTEKLPQIVTIRLRRPPPAIWETIWRWVGGEEKLNENRIILDNLKKKTERAYLAHRIPQSSLLTQLQNVEYIHFVTLHDCSDNILGYSVKLCDETY